MAKNKIDNISQLSRATGISKKSLTKMADNIATRIDFDTVAILCDELNCEFDELFILMPIEEYEETMKIRNRRKVASNIGHVYFIRDNDVDLIKIGRSTRFKNRLYSLEIEYKTKFDVLLLIPSNNIKTLEKEMHKRFDDYRFSGEWFKLPADELEKIMLEHKQTG